MPRKISEETKQLMQELYDGGLPIAEISEKLNVHYSSVWKYTKTRKKEVKSYSEDREHSAKQRQKRLQRPGLSYLIKEGLEKLGKNQTWLSKQIGVSRESVSDYAHGKYIPNEEILKKLFYVFKVKSLPKVQKQKSQPGYKPDIAPTQNEISQDYALKEINNILEPHNLRMDINGLERMVNELWYLESSIAGNVGDITYFKRLKFQNFLRVFGKALPVTCKQKKYATEISKDKINL